ncbi:MAG: hypothetical protein FWG14_06240 [Peptococcaceae bacterium]|nr:hypothetical protein [Peptococcaceae bacterium]
MKPRNPLRRINRGIVLAGLLLAGLVIYLYCDGQAFGTEETAIKDMLTAYAEEAETMMVLPGDVNKPGEKIPSDAIAQKLESNKPILEKYLTGSISGGSSAYSSAQFGLEDAFDNNKDLCAYVSECKFEIDVTGLKKIGTNMAKGSITVRTHIKTLGKPLYLKLFRTAHVEEESANNNNIARNSLTDTSFRPPADQEIDTETHSYTQETTLRNVYFKKVDGIWKVAEVNDNPNMGLGS